MLPPFGWSAVVAQWQFAPVVTILVVAFAALYGWGVVRIARQHPARPWPAWRTVLFGAGLAVIVIATESGVGVYDDLLFWDHMVQHLMLLMVAPPLLIFGQPMTLLLHASRNPVHTWAKRALRSRVASFLTWPVFGVVAYTAAVVMAHLTSAATTIDSNETLHNGEHAVFLIIGYLFFLPLLGSEPIRWRLSYPVRFVILVLIMPVDTFTGLVLGTGGQGTPGLPEGPRPGWAPTPVADLHAGGAVMWVGGDAIMFGLMMLVFLLWSTDDRAAAAGHGWLESARRTSMASLIAAHGSAPESVAPDAVPAGPAAPGSGAGAAPATVGPGTGADPATAAAAAQWSDGGIDDDEHLAAYNEFLARLNQGHAGRER
jgi:cytochrome c oxidase assembly factor CtaG